MRLLHRADSWIEVEITGRGTCMHAIIGRYSSGNFICVPNHGVGCGLSHYGDIFWNTQRLAKLLGKADAVTLACGLAHLDEL
jgi:hypothetical protein